MDRMQLTIASQGDSAIQRAQGLFQDAGPLWILAASMQSLSSLCELCGDENATMLLNVSGISAQEAEKAGDGENDRKQYALDLSIVMAEELADAALEEGAQYYVLRQIDGQSLQEMVRQGEDQPPARDEIDEMIDELCLRIGIPAHIQGYQFLCSAIRLVLRRPDAINHITKELYPGVAAQYGTTASKVERSIRHAISVLWNKNRVDQINKLFGFSVCTKDMKPTNGEFIALLAGKCKIDRNA